jgi:Peroxiredoxin
MKVLKGGADCGVVVMGIVLAASLAGNVVLGWKLRSVWSPRAGGVQVGATFPTIEVVSQEGRRERLSFKGAQPTVLYVMSPACVWCKKNQEGANALYRSIKGGYRVVGLFTTSENLAQYLKDHPVEFPSYTLASTEVVRSLGLDATPQTVVISPAGKVERAWMGAYLPERVAEIEKYFAISSIGTKVR